MPSYFYIKLFHEILHDPKMGRLTDNLWRRVIEVFLLAGENGRNGNLPDIETMAWELRLSVEELEANLQALARVNIVSQTPTGWHVTHFEKRQAPIDGKDRVSGFRDRAKKQNYYADETDKTQTSNESLQSRYTELELDIDKELELELDQSKKKIRHHAAKAAALQPQKIDKSALLIKDTSEDLQSALEKAYQSLGRKTPQHFKNEQQRDAYCSAIKALNGQSKMLIDKGISRERTSLSSLLAWLETCVKNQNSNGNGQSAEPSSPMLRAIARRNGIIK